MRISCFVVFGALLLPIVIAEAEDPNRYVGVTTTEESITTYNVSFLEQNLHEKQIRESQDLDKPRNARGTERMSSSPFFSLENPWTSLETFDKSPVFFEHENKEKQKLVLIEPFFRVKKVEKGFWGWLKKVFSENKQKKGQGPLIGPIKVPGMGDNVYIKGVEPLENESERVVIHLVTKDSTLGSSEKEIKWASPLSLGSSFGSFDSLHELPIESPSFQTIFSPYFSNGEAVDLFDKSQLSASPSWLSPSSPLVTFPPGKEDSFSRPSFFRKHSTDSEGSEFSGSPPSDSESHQHYTEWAQPYRYGSHFEAYSQNINRDQDQQGLFASENNQEVSSAREGIEKVKGNQTSQLELSHVMDVLPHYPPIFNSSFGLSESKDKDTIYVTYDKGSQNSDHSDPLSGSSSGYSDHPGLGAYQTQTKILYFPMKNISDEKYIFHDGIREVLAPDLSQHENRGPYKFTEDDAGEESDSKPKSDTENPKNSTAVSTEHSWNYENYGAKNSEKFEKISENSDSRSNETSEVVRKLFASYPWNYRVSKGRFVAPKTSEDEGKESTESLASTSNSQVQSQLDIRKTSPQRNRSRYNVDGNLKKDVRNNSRSRERVIFNNKKSESHSLENQKLESQYSDGKKLENPNFEEKNLSNQKSDIQTNLSKTIFEDNFQESKNVTKVLETEGKSKIEDDKEKGKKNETFKEEVKDTISTGELNKFYEEESKNLDDVLRTVEIESKAMEEESKTVEKKSKTVNEKSKSLKEERSSHSKKTTTEATPKAEKQKLSSNVYIVTPSNRLNSRTKFDIRTKKSPKEEVKKTDSVKVEIRKPTIQGSRVSIREGRFTKKFKNNTSLIKSNSTLQVENLQLKSNSSIKMKNLKPTPETHISRIYAKNRAKDKLISISRTLKPEEKMKNEEKQESKGEIEKFSGTMSEIEKQKEELHLRMAKLFPKFVNNKPGNDTEVFVTVKDESEIKLNQTQ